MSCPITEVALCTVILIILLNVPIKGFQQTNSYLVQLHTTNRLYDIVNLLSVQLVVLSMECCICNVISYI